MNGNRKWQARITTHLAAVAGAALEHQGMVASVHLETVVAEAFHMEAVRQKEEVASQASRGCWHPNPASTGYSVEHHPAGVHFSLARKR